jgi:hypothetical protein
MVEELKPYEESLRRGADAGSESCREGLEQLEEFRNEGEFFAEQLAWVVHGETRPQDIDQRHLHEWQKTATRLKIEYRQMGYK